VFAQKCQFLVMLAMNTDDMLSNKLLIFKALQAYNLTFYDYTLWKNGVFLQIINTKMHANSTTCI